MKQPVLAGLMALILAYAIIDNLPTASAQSASEPHVMVGTANFGMSGAAAMQEFTSKGSCEAAREVFLDQMNLVSSGGKRKHNVQASCVPK